MIYPSINRSTMVRKLDKVKISFIKPGLYSQILKNLPIVCIDLVIWHGREFILTKRKNQPAKDKWWLIGGRVFKNEKIIETINRKVREEASIQSIKKIEFLGFAETFFKKNIFGDRSHTINLVFKVEALSKNINSSGLDGKLHWFKKIDRRWPAYVRCFLKKARFN